MGICWYRWASGRFAPKRSLASTRRIRSRLIGTSGKCRRNIERLTGTRISVYGKTVAIIGKYTNAHLAAQAVEKIIKGIPHRSVYEFLEGKQDERDS